MVGGTGQAAPQELTHSVGRRGGERTVAVLMERLDVAGAPVQVGQDGVPEIRALQPGRGRQLVEERERGVRTLPLGDGDGAVQGVQRRRRALFPLGSLR
jgi:hypothetical protein